MVRTTKVKLKRDCEAIQIPLGTPIVLPANTPVRITQSTGDSHTVMTERRQMLRIDAKDSDALGLEPPNVGHVSNVPGTERHVGNVPHDIAPERPLREEHCLEVLRTCYDPELPVNVVDLGLVYECKITPLPEGGNDVVVRMTLTSPGCPMSDYVQDEIEEKLLDTPGVKRARVEWVFDPPWDPSRMTEAARLDLGLI